MTNAFKWAGKAAAALFLPALTVSVIAVGAYLTLVGA
jgi:hypothetical protein